MFPLFCLSLCSQAADNCSGLTYGVAKNATLIAVRALDCFGQASYSDVIMVGDAHTRMLFCRYVDACLSCPLTLLGH